MELHQAIVSGLSLDERFKKIIEEFLSDNKEKITGDELSSIYKIKSVLESVRWKQDKILSCCHKRYRDLVRIRNEQEAREKERQKIKDFLRKVEAKCAPLNSEGVKELSEKYFGEE